MSSSSIVPLRLPASTMRRMSSSPTSSSSAFGSMPMRRSTPFVETVSSQTSGAQSFAMNEIIVDIASASCSAFFIATRLGTSSPKMSVM